MHRHWESLRIRLSIPLPRKGNLECLSIVLTLSARNHVPIPYIDRENRAPSASPLKKSETRADHVCYVEALATTPLFHRLAKSSGHRIGQA
jgi:hypothetical protein